MEYQKIINLIGNTPDTKTMPKFNIKIWAEVNDQSGGTHNTNKQIRFITPMLRSDLCDFSDVYIGVKLTITIHKRRVANRHIGTYIMILVRENCGSFTTCISKINNNLIDNAEDFDIIMSMYNLIEYSKNYSKTSCSLWNYYRDEPSV